MLIKILLQVRQIVWQQFSENASLRHVLTLLLYPQRASR